MARVKRWAHKEIKTLIDNYATKTIQELMEVFPNRSQESINNKIKRLKAAGKIKGEKDVETVKRSYKLREKGKAALFEVD